MDEADLLEEDRHFQHVAHTGRHRDDVVRDREPPDAGDGVGGLVQDRDLAGDHVAVGDVRDGQQPWAGEFGFEERDASATSSRAA